MGRLVTLLLAGCAVAPDAFDEAYVRSWCEAYAEHCEGTPEEGPCVARANPTTLLNPSVTSTTLTTRVHGLLPEGCAYHAGKASTCLDVDGWTCGEDDQGRLQDPVAPDACAEVWTCE